MSNDDVYEELIAAGRRLAEGGLSPGSSGNLSVRDGDRIVVTRRGADLARLLLDDLVSVDLATGIALRGTVTPTKEVGMHRAAYLARPSARAIVHVHSHYATAISCLPPIAGNDADLPDYTPYRVMRLGRVPLVPFFPPGSDALADAVGAAARGAHAIALAHHGTLTIGSTVDEAVADAFEFEAAARLTLELRGTPASTLDTEGWGTLHP